MTGLAAALGAVRRRGRWVWRRTGVRLAAIQILVVLIAFGVAGMMTRAAIRASNEAMLRREILGEMASLQDEMARFGEGRIAGTIARRTRLWRGFDYGLEDRGGAVLAGRLHPPGRLGWMELRQPGPDAPDAFLIYVQQTPRGRWLAVGKNLAAGRRQMRMVTLRLVAAAACGALLSLAVWALFVRSTWRRLANIADAARLVADGRLAVRVAAAPRRRPDDIDEVGVALNAMLDRIGGLIGELRRVTTDVAHDLRTPLTRVRQRLEELEHAADIPTARRQVVARAQADLENLLRTFDALLQLAEIEGRSLGDEGAVVDLAQLAQRLAETFLPDVEAGGRRLEVEAGPALAAGDAALIAQMLVNLIENGMRHTPPGTTLRLRVAARADGAAQVVVADDGPGIPPELRQAVLTPFFRLDQSRGSPGSGVGLAIVAAVAARHGARLSLDDNAPGLRVTADFPPARRAFAPRPVRG